MPEWPSLRRLRGGIALAGDHSPDPGAVVTVESEAGGEISFSGRSPG
jgi:hypothetical protein